MKKSILLITIFLFFFVTSCKNDYPDSLWDPNYESLPKPEITTVEPEEGGIAGVQDLVLKGNNFSGNLADIKVYFDGKKGTVLAATSTEITVKAAPVVGDSVTIKVAVKGAYELGVYEKPYKLISATRELVGINNFVEAYGLGCDNNENIYTLDGVNTRILKMTHPDSNAIDLGDTEPVAVATGMKIGPENYLYFVSGIIIYRMPPAGGVKEDWMSTPRNARIVDLDFDENDNIFAVGTGGRVVRVKQDQTQDVVYTFSDMQFNALKIYDGYIYMAGVYIGSDTTAVQAGIWRNEILDSEGTLSEPEMYFDWASFAGDDGPQILCMTISEDGDILVGLDKDNAISIIHPDKTVEALYPDILTAPITYMTWGNDKFLYIDRFDPVDADKRRVYRVSMLEGGAPYFGRD